jgi:macrolide transport system ATP-binding/permease protein
MGLFGKNLKFALRQLVRNPGFAVMVILTLALAIGANTAIFSIVNALMIRSLPYADPERIGALFERIPGAKPYGGRASIDGERWELLRDQVPALISAVAGGVSGVNLQAGQRVEYLHAGRISPALSGCAGNSALDRAQLHGDRGSAAGGQERHLELPAVAQHVQ